jgi:hypothetical protein
MAIKFRPVELNEVDFKTLVQTELSAGREISALFLLHGFTEAFLRDWLFYSGVGKPADRSEHIEQKIDRLNCSTMIMIHRILGNLNDSLFISISKMNGHRNELAHNLINEDLSNEDFRNRIQSIVREGLQACENLHKNYRKTIEIKSKEYPS